MPHNSYPIQRALISVSDKTGLDDLGRNLHAKGVEIISTGGTRKYLEEHQIPCTPIEEVTGNPEAFDGRMKTLSFEICSALLFQRGKDDAEAEKLGISPIDLVVCNLYPFENTARSDAEYDELIENIDIGGVTLIRAAAKNHAHVCICTDPAQYPRLTENEKAETDIQTRKELALHAFRHTARYDAAISNRLEITADNDALYTPVLSAETATALRYGENPHQNAWVYQDPFSENGLAHRIPLQGKALSYNNLLDADAAWRCTYDLSQVFQDRHIVTIIKHLNPCGASVSSSALQALEDAWAGDPVSSFGGILCFSTEVTEDVAAWLDDKFIEIILAPSFSKSALDIFSKKKNLRVLISPEGEHSTPIMIRSISGGWVVQEEDMGEDQSFNIKTDKTFPDEKNMTAEFGTLVTKHLRSNAIALVQETENGFSLIGAGMGNPNRLVSISQAVSKARENGHQDLSEAVLISDAFFPFADNIELAEKDGIRFIVQPGGSIKDDDVIAACNGNDIAMAFTGRRHFRH